MISYRQADYDVFVEKLNRQTAIDNASSITVTYNQGMLVAGELRIKDDGGIPRQEIFNAFTKAFEEWLQRRGYVNSRSWGVTLENENKLMVRPSVPTEEIQPVLLRAAELLGSPSSKVVLEPWVTLDGREYVIRFPREDK